MGSVTFSSSSDYHYKDTPTVQFLNVGPEHDGWYSSSIKTTVSNGVISAFTVEVYYSIPNEYSSSSTPVANDNHVAYVEYDIVAEEADPNTGIDDVTTSNDGNIPWYGGFYSINVHGKKGSKYIVNLDKKASLTSNKTAHVDWLTDATFLNPYCMIDLSPGKTGTLLLLVETTPFTFVSIVTSNLLVIEVA